MSTLWNNDKINVEISHKTKKEVISMKFIKFCNRVVIPIIGLISLSVILSFPFLSNIFNHLFAIICFVCSLVIFPIIVLTDNSKNKKIDTVAMILVYYIFGGIFVINYFNTPFNWLWFVFGLIIIIIPFSFCFINYWYRLKNKPTKEQKVNFKRNAIKYTLFYYILDLFYMSFIIDNLLCRYIFGGIIILYIFYNSTKAFINNIKPRIIFIIQDVFIGLGITIYLIFIIPNGDLRNVVTSIVSAVFGGYVTLLGVAWTIKDNSRNRKEDERLSKVPYLYIVKENYDKTFKSFAPVLDEAFKTFNDETTHCISINEFIIKNSNNSDCVPCGFVLNGKFYHFDNMFFVERNKCFKVEIAHNHTLNSKQYEVMLSIIVKDVLDNYYQFDCELKFESELEVLFENKHIPVSKYDVINLHLPQKITKEELI